MRDGNFVVGVTTINHRGEKVLEGTAEVAQSTTVYAFTGQGSQEQGMGMGLYNSSPAARSPTQPGMAMRPVRPTRHATTPHRTLLLPTHIYTYYIPYVTMSGVFFGSSGDEGE